MLLMLAVFLLISFIVFWFLEGSAFKYAYNKGGMKGLFRMIVAYSLHKVAGWFIKS